MTVKAILSQKGSDVLTIDPAATLADAAKLLAERRIGAVLITGVDGRLAGILSERDIVRALAERGAGILGERVDRTMTRKVVTCAEGETIASIMERMTAGKFRHLPVVEQGRLVGVISIGDVVKYRLHEIESESEALREYILTA
jgi:CBS domain-containing protein